MDINEVTPEKLAELETKAQEAEALKVEVAKLKDKEMNFSKFRSKTTEEKQQYVEQLSAKERILYERMDELETQVAEKDQLILGGAKEKKIRELTGNDKDLAAELEAQVGRLKDKPRTAEELDSIYEDAFVLVQRRKGSERVNPINSFSAGSGQTNSYEKRVRNYADTDDGKNLASDLGLTLEPPKKS